MDRRPCVVAPTGVPLGRGSGRLAAGPMALGLQGPGGTDHRPRHRRPCVVKAIVLLGSAAGAYVLASWAVAPGFYDCCATAPIYNWVCPPPGLTAGNLPPKSGQALINV